MTAYRVQAKRVRWAACVLGVFMSGLGPGFASAAEPPRVAVSIKPIHALVAGVMSGVAEPELIVDGASSPHDYAMRPSDARLLNEAEIIFRVSDSLESFLVKPIEALAGKARVVSLIDEPGVRLLPTREGGVWDGHDHEAHGDHGGTVGDTHHGHDDHGHAAHDDHHGHEAHDDHGGHDDHAHHEAGVAGHHDDAHAHDHGAVDAHIWLDIGNAKAIVAAVERVLRDADPDHAETYSANARALDARLDALDAELERTLAPIADRPYVVFHDAYGYLEARYGLSPVGTITVTPDQKPGARRIAEIRAKVRDLDAVCVFAEPQFEPAVIATVVEGTDAGQGVLDPLGAVIEPGEGLYFTLMRDLAASLSTCLRMS